jgi:hypothetical protein
MDARAVFVAQVNARHDALRVKADKLSKVAVGRYGVVVVRGSCCR